MTRCTAGDPDPDQATLNANMLSIEHAADTIARRRPPSKGAAPTVAIVVVLPCCWIRLVLPRLYRSEGAYQRCAILPQRNPLDRLVRPHAG